MELMFFSGSLQEDRIGVSDVPYLISIKNRMILNSGFRQLAWEKYDPFSIVTGTNEEKSVWFLKLPYFANK